MLSENQKIYLDVNKPANFLLVGEPSLIYNKLMYGHIGCEPLVLYTPFDILDGVNLGDVYLEHYHFNDDDNCSIMDPEYRLWLPTAERAIVDTIQFLDKNYIEGPLIESLQTYIEMNKDLSRLYMVADHYGVSKGKVDYWIKEAKEESDMSMG